MAIKSGKLEFIDQGFGRDLQWDLPAARVKELNQ